MAQLDIFILLFLNLRFRGPAVVQYPAGNGAGLDPGAAGHHLRRHGAQPQRQPQGRPRPAHGRQVRIKQL